MLWKKDGKGNLKNFCMVLVSVLYAPLFLPTVCKETYSKQLASDIATQPLTKQQLCGGHIRKEFHELLRVHDIPNAFILTVFK